MSGSANRRVLVVDGDGALGAGLARVLSQEPTDPAGRGTALDGSAEAAARSAAVQRFELAFTRSDEEALARIRAARDSSRPFAVVFVAACADAGRDALSTIERLRAEDPDLQCILSCFSEPCSIEELLERFGESDSLFVLPQPLDPFQARQTVTALAAKWGRTVESRAGIEQLSMAEQEARAYAASMVTMNRALLGARATAQAADSSKCHLLSSIGHELRAPVLSIVGHAEALSREPAVGVEPKQSLDAILDGGQWLLRLVDGVMALGALESGLVRVERRACSVVEILDGVRKSFARHALQKGLSLTIEYASGTPQHLLCDQKILGQALAHIVENAIKFTDRGGVKVSVTPTAGEDAVPYLLFDVEDTGVGIASVQQAQVFEAFHHTDADGEPDRSGTRLGLMLARRLARLLDATIEFESEPGRGTCFTIAVPVGEVVESDQDLLYEPAPVESHGMRGRVLLVEDVRVTQRLLALQLRRAGLDVDVADNGSAALDRLQRANDTGSPFDLVLMDMQMPVMDGYEATRRIRELRWHVPVIAVTARALPGDRQRCLDVGCDDYLPKPVERADLLRCVAGWLVKAPKAPLPSVHGAEARPAARADSPLSLAE